MALIHQTLLALFSLIFQSITCVKFSLGSEAVGWSAFSRKAGNLSGAVIPATIPGDIYSDLKHGGYIGDPYYHAAQSKLRFISEANWTQSTKFHVSDALLKYERLVLILEGVDTVSSIYLNQQLIGTTDNMFVRYKFSIKHALKVENQLTINITSPVHYSLYKSRTFNYKLPPECPQDVNHSYICHRNFIRKEQASFPWHWGPALPTMGIWRPIYIIAENIPALTDLLPEIISAGNSWLVKIRVQTNIHSSDIRRYVLLISLDGVYSYQLNVSDQDEIRTKFYVSKQRVKPWWPNGYGEQTLYKLSVSLQTYINTQKTVNFIDKLIAFRHVELIQDQLPGGKSFYFRINGVPIFMKGSNWQPADNFHYNITTERIDDLLMSVKQANMNMLRVWGGGRYEKDPFYNMADRLGIMIWQDFMFANSVYPTDKEALTHEITSQELSSAVYVFSSPSNGERTEHAGGISDQPNSPLWGDVHYYNYTAGRWYSDDHPKARFLSEYGVMSWPSLATLKQISHSSDWEEFSDFTLERNRRAKGQQELNSQIRYYFNSPNSTSDPVLNFTYYIYLTQIHQAMYVRQVTLFARRHQNYVNEYGGYTMGALYWKLNNIWPAPSWSSLEFNGDWKMLHYYMKQSFQPTALTLAVEQSYLYAYIIMEHNKTALPDPSGFTLECHEFNSFAPIVNKNYTIDVWNKTQVSERFQLDKYETIITELNCTNSDSYLKITWGDHYDYGLLHGFKSYKASPSKIKVFVGEPLKKDHCFVYAILLETSQPEFYIWLTTSHGARNFTDNGFIMDMSFKRIDYVSGLYQKSAVLQNDIHVLVLADLYAS